MFANRPCLRTARAAAVYAAMFAGFGMTAGASAQSNACGSATLVGPGSYAGTTSGATQDGSTNCGNGTSSPDVWFKVIPAAQSVLVASTCTGAGFDTVVSVHSGCPGTAANQIHCSDDAASCAGGGSIAVAQAEAGQTYYIRVGGFQGAHGSFTLTVTLEIPQADPAVGEIIEMAQYGRVADTVGISMGAPLCNRGNTPHDTFRTPDTRHPMFNHNLYRLKNGRLEQIGASWTKHMRGAAQDDNCGLGCPFPWPDFTRLGPGCSDTYTALTSSNQVNMGPRTEVNPWTGIYTYPGSYIEQNIPVVTAVERRMQARDADLNAAQNPGAVYFAEFHIIAHDDTNHANSVAHEQITVSGAPGGTWAFGVAPVATVVGPTIAAWPGSARTAFPASPTTDGTGVLAVKTSNNGDGTWHYEYALYNQDMDRAIQALSVPVGVADVSNIGFSAVRSHEEPFHNNAWTTKRAGNLLTWSTDTFASNPNSNPLRWGTMYNFWFDSTGAPVASSGVLTPYKPGAPASYACATTAPATECAADADANGAVEPADIAMFVNRWLASLQNATLVGDFDGDGDVAPADIALFVNTWFGALSGGC